MRLAPEVTRTRLPFGGTVLVNGVTMDLAECQEPQSAILDRLLDRSASDAPATRAFAAALLEGGWLIWEDCPDGVA
ncbi:actinodefensin-associated protein B [Amycolatopsis alba]|uniref:actinodefensin-associated protein B n=1 Tax=Amycolatopsis alba TaxID=76020 RepID=UPI0012FBA68C|nr:actinodefensin-associated protein B [Amycolatopsis alba]